MEPNTMQQLRRTPLYEFHVNAGARFVPFGAWEMPVQYSGLIDEHNTVRACAGIFDVSHMGEVTVKGKDAEAFLQHVTVNDVSKLSYGRAQYSMLLYPHGGVVDDIIVYKFGNEDFFLCVNASNADKDFEWLQQCAKGFSVNVENVSDEYVQIALQGPKAEKILTTLFPPCAGKVKDNGFSLFSICKSPLFAGGKDVLIARTGYTGEDGYEIFSDVETGKQIWQVLLTKGKDLGVKPIGLGARDTLRLEACLPLYGHELTDTIDPLSSGLAWVIKLKKGDFIGRDALLKVKENGTPWKLVGLEVTDNRGILREGTKIFSPVDRKEIGWVTSGTKTPTTNKPIGLAFVKPTVSELGTELFADIRGKDVQVKVIATPFYRRPKS